MAGQLVLLDHICGEAASQDGEHGMEGAVTSWWQGNTDGEQEEGRAETQIPSFMNVLSNLISQ